MDTVSIVDLLRLIVADIALVVGISILVGALAPWVLGSILDRNLLPLLPGESPQLYRRLGVQHLTTRLPEYGGVFGGRSKAALPGRDPESLRAYLCEVRRAQLVHFISCFSWVVLITFNPWWMTAAFAVVVIAVNLPFLLILRNNQARIEQTLVRAERRQ